MQPASLARPARPAPLIPSAPSAPLIPSAPPLPDPQIRQAISGISSRLFATRLGRANQRPSPAINLSGARQLVAANRIKTFLRKAVAAQAYGRMFAEGRLFKDIGLSMPSLKNGSARFSFKTLDQLDRISEKNLNAIRSYVGRLKPAEEQLQELILTGDWSFRHQSNADLTHPDGIKIFSGAMLARKQIPINSHTTQREKELLGNDDFVFFGVEFSGGYKHRLPALNKKHSGVDYGAQAFFVNAKNSQCRHGYLTLTSHFNNSVPAPERNQNTGRGRMFPVAAGEVPRQLSTGTNDVDAPMFSARDMKKALTLYLIDFLRKTRDPDVCWWVSEYLYEAACERPIAGGYLDSLMNFAFSPEFHIPRMLSTRSYYQQLLRPMELIEVVKASNFRALDKMLSFKPQALSAMAYAIHHTKSAVALHLLEKWSFTKEDFAPTNPVWGRLAPVGKGDFAEPGHLLSKGDASLEVLEQLLRRQLIDPNARFRSIQCTMLDNAVRCENTEMIMLLLAHGARPDLLSPDNQRNWKTMAHGGSDF
ncbi:T3SS effector OspC family protein [Herbaspirillum sp. RTI4]|uniref:T3SS effector OspC family protein n=1 Tax=Herbaspirillum sp. RTI4 TaxID=3048640 RepID=UPI002AB3CAF4|nr:T3SS effector OspC family protein [Herbaspirillum sp. RTI4]MDY7577842.1 T3SS effector OspC family protein [Herbaspirillum sp. RTI4]MEA9982460.1 T3SS effector OspC family protein [Herbaspirillum sp. RTI4]